MGEDADARPLAVGDRVTPVRGSKCPFWTAECDRLSGRVGTVVRTTARYGGDHPYWVQFKGGPPMDFARAELVRLAAAPDPCGGDGGGG